MNIGLIYGSDTGATEEISIKIKDAFNNYNIERHNIANVNTEIILSFDFLIFGLSNGMMEIFRVTGKFILMISKK